MRRFEYLPQSCVPCEQNDVNFGVLINCADALMSSVHTPYTLVRLESIPFSHILPSHWSTSLSMGDTVPKFACTLSCKSVSFKVRVCL